MWLDILGWMSCEEGRAKLREFFQLVVEAFSQTSKKKLLQTEMSIL